MSDIEASFQSTLRRLLIYSPFSFNMLVGMEHKSTESIETMGVCVKNGRITLAYNPNFFAALDESERNFVLIHEMMHVLLHHCTHRTSGDLRRACKENIAMDLAINCMIPEEAGVKMPRFKEDVGVKKKGEIQGLLPSMFGFKDGLSYEQYMALLDKKFPDDTVILISSGGDGDKDGMELSEKCPLGKIAKHRIDEKHGSGFDEDAYIDDYVRNEVEKIERNHTWGNLGSNAVEMVKKAQEQPLNWGDLLRLKLGPFLSFQKEPSRRRWNKHYGKPFLGNTTKSVEPVAVYADTSGSVGSEDLSRFVVEIERIANYTGVYLWSFDTDIKDPDENVLFTHRTIDAMEFKGRGGTYFAPIFEHARKKNISQVVVLTDGYADKITAGQIEGLEVIWVITRNGNKDNKAGTVIEMK